MGLIDYIVVSLPPRHPTGPAPYPLPAGLLLSEKRYGSAIPLVLGQAVVPALTVWRGNRFEGDGYTHDGLNWLVANAMQGLDVVLALCEAPVSAVTMCFKRFGSGLKGVVAAEFSKLYLAGGSMTAITAADPSAWSAYVGTAAEGMAHAGTCHVRVVHYALADDGSIPETRWEVQGTDCVTSVSTPNAEAAEILLFLLTNTTHGLGYSTSLVDVIYGADGNEASGYRRYCRARGFHLSRAIIEGERIVDIIQQLLFATNSTLITVDGKLKAIPLDDESSSTSGLWPGHATYPYTAVTSSTSIGDDDFDCESDEDPVHIDRRPKSSIASIFPVKYTLRKNDSGEITYDTAEEQWVSDVWAGLVGLRRAETIDLSPWILNQGVATHAYWISYLAAQRAINHRTRYTFRVKPEFSFLAPGDFVTVSDSILGLSGIQARIESTEEDSEGRIEILALEWPLGTTANAPTSVEAPAGRGAASAAREFAAADGTNLKADAVQPAAAASETPTITIGSGWNGGGGSFEARRTAAMVSGTIKAVAESTGSPSWSSVFTLPSGYRPVLSGPLVAGIILDSDTGLFYGALVEINGSGVGSVHYFDNGTTWSETPPFTLAVDDTVWITFSFPWQ